MPVPAVASSCETRIYLCMGTSCFQKGNAENLRIIRDFLDQHGISATVRPTGHLCEGMCSKGPSLILNGSVYYGVNGTRMRDLLSQHVGMPQKARILS